MSPVGQADRITRNDFSRRSARSGARTSTTILPLPARADPVPIEYVVELARSDAGDFQRAR